PKLEGFYRDVFIDALPEFAGKWRLVETGELLPQFGARDSSHVDPPLRSRQHAARGMQRQRATVRQPGRHWRISLMRSRIELNAQLHFVSSRFPAWNRGFGNPSTASPRRKFT